MSIYAYLREHPDEYDPPLPDEQERDGDVRWAPGARDGVLTHHWGGAGEEELTEDLLAAIRDATTGIRRSRGYQRLCERAADIGLVAVLDPLLRGVREAGLPAGRVYE